eukprot:GHRQ01023802.1.p1 GENE.GHRQ01023802.1~~GHRQ01023802.1.p1  ORF type:complete len:144 (-),score=0.44 GHRQ01023802.1:87-518(-)
MSPAAISAGAETFAAILVPQHHARNYSKEEYERADHVEGFFELGPREVHPWHKPAMPSQEQLQSSANSPVIVTPNPMVMQQVCAGCWYVARMARSCTSGANRLASSKSHTAHVAMIMPAICASKALERERGLLLRAPCIVPGL